MEFYITGMGDFGPVLRGRVFLVDAELKELGSAFIYIHEREMLQARNPASLLRSRAFNACQTCLQMYRATFRGLTAGRHLVGCRDCSAAFWCDCLSGEDCPWTCDGCED